MDHRPPHVIPNITAAGVLFLTSKMYCICMESKAKACVYDCNGTFIENDSFETVSAIVCSAKPMISAMFNKNVFNNCVLEKVRKTAKKVMSPSI